MEKSKGNQIELEELRDELLRREKQSNATSHELAEVQQHAAKLRKELNHAIDRADNAVRESKQCADELTDANVENDKLTAELKRTALEVKSQQETIGDLRGSLEEITARYQKHVRESQMLATRERELLDNLKTTEYERDEFKAKYAALMGDHQSLRSENEELLSLSQKFENRIVQLETRDMEGFGELQRQAEIVRVSHAAEAKLEYDKALIREQQAQAEIQRLADKMLEIPAKARERAEQEINTMRAQFNKEKQQLTAEVTALETKCSHLQHQSERAIRDKRSAESEVEKLTRHIPEEADRLAVTLEELNTRLRTSERDKNLAMGRLETLHQKLLREEHRFEKEKQLVAERSDDAYRRLRTVERDLEETKEDRLHMLTKHTELEHAHKRLAEAKQKAAAQHESDMAALTERHEDHIKDLTTKLETVTESHTRTCRDIQQVLSDQKRASDKWAQDHEQLTHHYEHSLNDLRSQIGRAAARAEDLESQCANARNRIKELMGQLGEEKRNTARAVARCQNAEMRMEGLGRQIASVTSKEAELVEERKRLQRDLDRANLDKERMEREHSLAVRAHNQSRFRNTLRSNVDDHEDDRSLFIDDSSREVRELKARIDRVKHRSNSRAHHHEPLLDDMIDGADDPLDDLSD
ncbi:hypothetical protein DFJ77DRAFT_233483 [Powellomyces hirtus]|nr:hypothetical protein DFJ77DRAFT_233483 [Powellomyces hirtus]